jgi:hypothetical protein
MIDDDCIDDNEDHDNNDHRCRRRHHFSRVVPSQGPSYHMIVDSTSSREVNKLYLSIVIYDIGTIMGG